MTWWAVALGAALGAPARFLLDGALSARFGRRLPWGTLTVNALGSAAAGLLAGLVLAGAAADDPVPPALVGLLGVGFLGAFTTASTLAVEVLELATGDDRGAGRRAAALTVLLSAASGLVLAGLGLAAGLAAG